MRIALGTFACLGIESHLGSDVPAAARAALARYLGKLESCSPPIDFPRFRREDAPAEAAVSFELPMDTATQTALTREAVTQGTTVSQLVTHAVLDYLAELDSPDSVRAWA